MSDRLGQNEQVGKTELHPASFHGTRLGTKEVAGLRVTEVTYPPNMKTRWHSHEYAYLGITLKGTSTQTYRDKARAFGPCTVAFHPSGEVHRDHFHWKGTHELNIEIAPSRLEMVREYTSMVDDSMHSVGGRCGWLAAKLYGEFRHMDDLSLMAIDGLVLELLAEIYRRGKLGRAVNCPPWLKQARELIEERFTENVTLQEIARAVGIHPVHLARAFHRWFGRTIGEQFRVLRVECAARMIEQGQPLAEVALAAGFSDQSHLSKTFQSLVGTTPGEFRRDFIRANPQPKR